MHTKDMLAQALRDVGLNAMADKAATGYYHDYLSPLDLPEMQLVNDLMDATLDHPEKRDDIMLLRARVIQGSSTRATKRATRGLRAPKVRRRSAH